MIKLQNELQELNNSVTFNSSEIEKKQKIIKKIDTIEEKIISLQSQDRMEYYNKAGDIIYNYYNYRDNDNDKKIGVSILDLMNKKEKELKDDNTIKEI